MTRLSGRYVSSLDWIELVQENIAGREGGSGGTGGGYLGDERVVGKVLGDNHAVLLPPVDAQAHRLHPCRQKSAFNRRRANMAHTRQARPDLGLGIQVKVLKTFEVVRFSLGRVHPEYSRARRPKKVR